MESVRMPYSEENTCLDLARYEDRFTIVLKAAKLCVFELDLTKRVYTLFENAEDIFGVSGDIVLQELQGFHELSLSEYQKAMIEYFSHPDDADVIQKLVKNISNGKTTTIRARIRAGGSRFIWCKIDASPLMENGIPVRMIGVITDISAIKAKTELLERVSKLDRFTGLYDKKYSEKIIREVISKKSDQRHALILIDVDNFKAINDTYGHAVGDDIIKSIAKIIKKVFKKTDVAGRFGGDEFIILVKNLHKEEWLGDRLKHLLENKINDLTYTNSLGVSIYPDDGTDYDELFRKADLALYHAKGFKNAYALYNEL